MSIQNAKLASKPVSRDPHPASGQRPALRYRPQENSDMDEPSGFSGTCENTPLSDWIQLVQMGRRDAVVGIQDNDGRKALLWFCNGDIIDAWCDDVTGESAVYRALCWDGGQISVTFAPCERPRRIETATPALLLRAAYYKDAGLRELKAQRPTPSSPVSSAPASRAVTASPPAVMEPPLVEELSVAEAPPAVEEPALLVSPPAVASSPAAALLVAPRRPTWIASSALGGAFVLLALAVFWPVKPRSELFLTTVSRPLTTRTEAARPGPAVASRVILACEQDPNAPSPERAAPPSPSPAKPVQALAIAQGAPRRGTVSEPAPKAKPVPSVVEAPAASDPGIDSPVPKMELIE